MRDDEGRERADLSAQCLTAEINAAGSINQYTAFVVQQLEPGKEIVIHGGQIEADAYRAGVTGRG